MNNRDLLKAKKLIARGDLNKTIKYLIDLFVGVDSSFYNQVLLISARYNSIRRDEITNSVGNDFEVKRQKVAYSLLNLIDDYIEYLELINRNFVQPDQVEKVIEVLSFDIIDTPDEIRGFYQNWKFKYEGYYPVFDFKLLNISSSPVLVSSVYLELEQIGCQHRTLFNEALPISWDYNLLVDVNNQLEKKELKVAQIIYPNRFDRFIVTVGGNLDAFEYIEYKCNVKLFLSNNEELALGEKTFTMYLPDDQDTIVLKKMIRN